MAAVLTPTTPTTSATTIAMPTGSTGSAMPAAPISSITGSTGATPIDTATTEAPKEEITNLGSDVGTKINDLMLWYFVSAYAYSFAYLKTVMNIQDAPDGHGIFNTISTGLIGVLDSEGLKKESEASLLGEVELENLASLEKQIELAPTETEEDKESKRVLIDQYNKIKDFYEKGGSTTEIPSEAKEAVVPVEATIPPEPEKREFVAPREARTATSV